MLFYSKQILSFSKDIKMSLPFADSKASDNNFVPVIFETNVSGFKTFITRDITAQTAAAAIIEFIPPHPNSKKFPASIPQTVPAIAAQLKFDPVSL